MAYKKALTDEEQRLIDGLVAQDLTLKEMSAALGYKGSANMRRVVSRLRKAGYYNWEPRDANTGAWQAAMREHKPGTLLHAIFKVGYKRGMSAARVAELAGISPSVINDLRLGRRNTHGGNLQAIIDALGPEEVFRTALEDLTDGF